MSRGRKSATPVLDRLKLEAINAVSRALASGVRSLAKDAAKVGRAIEKSASDLDQNLGSFVDDEEPSDARRER